MIFKAGLIAFFLSALSAFLVSRLGSRISLIDIPNERSSHLQPIPCGGGIGIWLSFILTSLLIPFPSLFTLHSSFFTLMAGIVGLLGLIEDRYELPSKARLISQLVLSVAIVILYSKILLITFLSLLPMSLLLFLFWVAFISGTANFYNFMDGINGIAGLTGIVGFGLLAVFSALVARESYVFSMSIALVSGCLGFLPFNFPKAKVFMGDVGSVFLGFIFGSFVVGLSENINIFICLIMFLCTFYADTIVTIFYRWHRGENLMQAHRSHLYQYMSNELKIPHWKVSIGYAVIQLIFGLMAIWAYNKNIILQTLIIAIFGVLFITVYNKVKKISPKAI